MKNPQKDGTGRPIMTHTTISKLHEIAAVLSQPIGEQPLIKIFQWIAPKLRSLLNTDHSTITLLDNEFWCFRIHAEFPELSPPLVGELISIQDRAMQRKIVDRHEPVIANDLKDHALMSESQGFWFAAQSHDIRSMLIVPMVSDGITIGTISVDMIGRTKTFTPMQVELCQTAANQLAAFIEITRSREKLKNRPWQEEAFSAERPPNDPSGFSAFVAQKLFLSLAELIEFKKASIQLIFDSTRILVGAFGFDPLKSNKWLLRPVDTDPIILNIVQTQKSTILAETSCAAHWQKQPDTSDVNSWIGVPLVFHGRTIGIITLDHDQPGFYSNITEPKLIGIENLAARAAYSFGTAYNIEIAQHQARAWETLQLFAETVAIKLKQEDLLHSMVSAISNGLRSTRCSVFLLEQTESSSKLVCRAVCQGTLCTLVEGPPLPDPPPESQPCPVIRAFRTGNAFLIQDRGREEHYDFSNAIYDDSRSMLAVPLKAAGTIIGVILAVHRQPSWFSTSDRLLLETLARQAATAIERNTGLELVHSIGNKMLVAKEVDAVLQDVVMGAIKLTHADSGVIYVLSKDGKDVILSCKPEGSVHPQPRLKDPQSVTRRVLILKKILEIPDIEEDDRVNPELRGQYRSMVAVPLLLKQSVLGVLYLNSRTVYRLTETEKSLLETLAAQSALAIQSAGFQWRWQSLVKQSPDGIVVLEKGRIKLANPAAEQLFGVSAGKLENRSILEFVDPRFRSRAKYLLSDSQEQNAADQTVEKGLDEKSDWEPMVEMCIVRSPDEKIDVEVYTRHFPRTGETQAVFHDITRTKGLLREMHHRVRRSFNQVNGFLTLQKDFTDDAKVLRTFDALREQIQAMALVHTTLYRTGEESDVNMSLYLDELKQALLKEHTSSQHVAVTFSAGNIVMKEKQATAIGLIVTELVSNSLLHAFGKERLMQPNNKVEVSLCRQETQFILSVWDNGSGFERKGFESMGLSLVKSLVSDDLKGRIVFASGIAEGTLVTIKFSDR
jgi:two-component system, sensor histidine kinase PdtaS